MDGESYGNEDRSSEDMNTTFLDSPGDTNSHTYKVQILKNGTGTLYLNRRRLNNGVGYTSSITVQEVAA